MGLWSFAAAKRERATVKNNGLGSMLTDTCGPVDVAVSFNLPYCRSTG
jgi:hypothetical protein